MTVITVRSEVDEFDPVRAAIAEIETNACTLDKLQIKRRGLPAERKGMLCFSRKSLFSWLISLLMFLFSIFMSQKESHAQTQKPTHKQTNDKQTHSNCLKK